MQDSLSMQNNDLTPIQSPSTPIVETAHSAVPPIGLDPFSPDYLNKTYRFKFHGDAMEYFGIWIVNIALTIITLSLYAPWAKVRRLRYFYSNTEFFHRFFDFTGIPTKILIGRLIALGIWGVFAFISSVDLIATLIGLVLIYLAVPWLIRATVRFTARNSKFSNSRFYFSGTTKRAYIEFFKALGIIIFSFGIFMPVAIWIYKRYLIDHLYAGQLKFSLNNKWSDYMSAYYVPIFFFFGVMAVVVPISIAVFGIAFSSPTFMGGLIALFYVLGLFFVGPLIQARIFITTWNHTKLNNSQFQTDCNQWRFAWIVGTNWIVRILSLGLMSAWAAIRITKYQVESLSLHLIDDPNEMMNKAQQDHNALGEELSDIFDIDISL